MAEPIRCQNCKHWDAEPVKGRVLVAGYCQRIVPRPMVKNAATSLFEYPGDPADDEARTLGAFLEPDVPSYPASLRTTADHFCGLAEQRASTDLCDKPGPNGFVCIGDRGHKGGCIFAPPESGEAVMARLRVNGPQTFSMGSFAVNPLP